jgi:hypothetical protein
MSTKSRFSAVFLFILLNAFAHAAPKAVIAIEKLDFGTVKSGEIAEKIVPLRNDGDAPFTILRTNSSCPCVIFEKPSAELSVVKPGLTINLPIKYDPKDRVGPQGAVVAIMTDDPANPALTLDIAAFVEALVVVRPPNGITWGYVKRGNTIGKTLDIAPGNVKNDIELVDIKSSNPGVNVTIEKKTEAEERKIIASFTISPEVPLGTLEATITARVRVGTEEAEIKLPMHGEIIGDLLVTPPAIISPQIAYTLGQRISEITVRASEENAEPPKLLGAMAVGSVKATVIKGANAKAHMIAVHVGENVNAGPQSGTVYVMTDSKDQPITAVPVYFRMGESVRAEPAAVAVEAGAKQRVALRPASGEKLKITNIGFEEEIVNVEVVQPEPANADTPAAIEITALAPAKPDRLSSIVVIETDAPGGSRVYVPVAIRPE